MRTLGAEEKETKMAATITFLVGVGLGWFLCRIMVAKKLERLSAALNWFLKVATDGGNGHFLIRVSNRLNGNKSEEIKKAIRTTDWSPLQALLRAVADLLPEEDYVLRVHDLERKVVGPVVWVLLALAIASSLLSPTPVFAAEAPDCYQLETLPQLVLGAGESLRMEILEGCRISNGTATFLVYVVPGHVVLEEGGVSWEEPYYASLTAPAYVPTYVAGSITCQGVDFFIKSQLPFGLFELAKLEGVVGKLSVSDEGVFEFQLFKPYWNSNWGTCSKQ